MNQRRVWIVVIVLLWVTAAGERLNAQDEASDLMGRVNALRASLGLAPYGWNGSLAAAAQSQAQWMVETATVSHTRSDGSTPRTRALAAGYPTLEVSENIYAGTNASVGDAWSFWMNSRIHYAGITNVRYQEIGVGVARGEWGSAYVLIFGNPGGAPPPPPNAAGSSAGSAQSAPPSFVVGLDSHGNIMHEVQPGDTIGQIALIYGYTWSDIPAMLALNGMIEADIRDLEIGSVFLVPPQDGTYTPTPGGEPPTLTATATPPAESTPLPTATAVPPSPTLPIVTAASVPQVAVVLAPGATTSPTTLAVADASLVMPSVASSGEVSITPGGSSPWLTVALLVQVGVLVVAVLEFIRRARRR